MGLLLCGKQRDWEASRCGRNERMENTDVEPVYLPPRIDHAYLLTSLKTVDHTQITHLQKYIAMAVFLYRAALLLPETSLDQKFHISHKAVLSLHFYVSRCEYCFFLVMCVVQNMAFHVSNCHLFAVSLTGILSFFLS